MLRCGLISYGAWGSHRARVIAAGAHTRLVAIAALSDATCARAQEQHPGCHVFTDPRELLARDDLDAVAVVLPSHLHFEAAREVIGRRYDSKTSVTNRARNGNRSTGNDADQGVFR
jgi:predicted dehydrogenase